MQLTCSPCLAFLPRYQVVETLCDAKRPRHETITITFLGLEERQRNVASAPESVFDERNTIAHSRHCNNL